MHPSQYSTLFLTAAVAACSPGFAGPVPEATLTVLEPAGGLTLQVGTALGQPIQVLVQRNGTPVAGIRVTWAANQGQLTATTTTTGADGVATARWLLGVVAGTQRVSATIREASRPVYFTVEAVPGPPAQVVKVSGDDQVINVLAASVPAELVVGVLDQFANPIRDAAVVWSVMEGPATIAEPPRVVGFHYHLQVSGTGQAGTARIRASVGGVTMATPFTVEFGDGPWVVAISNLETYHLIGFRSLQNGTTPAIDTIPAGASVQFVNQDYWDVAQSHDVIPLGLPALPPCQLVTYAYDSRCEIILTMPGTYRYGLSGSAFATGTIVVRSP